MHTECLQREWIQEQIASIRGENRRAPDPGILEKAIHALALLEYLADEDFPFVFKGGTSLMLLMDSPKRLSTDIDIACVVPFEELISRFSRIAQKAPFMRMEEDVRDSGRRPPRRHFRFSYQSPWSGREDSVLLDVLVETFPLATVMRPIQTSFMKTDSTRSVLIPTVESLLADKLCAFAPNTTGVPIRLPSGDPHSLQIVKQLYDVACLFDLMSDLEAFRAAYPLICTQEIGYRADPLTLNDVLQDTLRTSLLLTAHKFDKQLKSILRSGESDDLAIMLRGVNGLGNHIFAESFSKERELIECAGKAALLAAILLSGKPFDWAPFRSGSMPAPTMQGEWAFLERMRAIVPKAYVNVAWALELSKGNKK